MALGLRLGSDTEKVKSLLCFFSKVRVGRSSAKVTFVVLLFGSHVAVSLFSHVIGHQSSFWLRGGPPVSHTFAVALAINLRFGCGAVVHTLAVIMLIFRTLVVIVVKFPFFTR